MGAGRQFGRLSFGRTGFQKGAEGLNGKRRKLSSGREIES